MPVRVEATADSGLLVLHDAGVTVPAVERDGMGPLEREAEAGRLFFLSADDPMRFRVDVYSGGEPLPPELQHDLQSLGTFLLDLPSGRLVLAGHPPTGGGSREGATLTLGSGPHALTVFGRRPFDARSHDQEMVSLVGEADWKFSSQSNWLGLVGCLPTLLALGALLLAFRQRRFDVFLYGALPVAILAWLPHVVLRTSGRYRRISRQMAEHEATKPLFAFRLAPAEKTVGLGGGFLSV